MGGISKTQYPLATPTKTTTTSKLTTHVETTSLIFSQMKLRQKSVAHENVFDISGWVIVEMMRHESFNCDNIFPSRIILAERHELITSKGVFMPKK